MLCYNKRKRERPVIFDEVNEINLCGRKVIYNKDFISIADLNVDKYSEIKYLEDLVLEIEKEEPSFSSFGSMKNYIVTQALFRKEIKSLKDLFSNWSEVKFSIEYNTKNYFKFCGHTELIPTKYKNNFIGMQKTILECEADNLEHIIPYVILFRRTPKKIREMVGRGAWKKIHKRSLTQNIKIVSCVFDDFRIGSTSVHDKVESIKEILQYEEIPSTAHRLRGEILHHCLYAIDYTSISTIEKIMCQDIIADMHNMSTILNYPINKKWKYRRCLKEHDEMSNRFTLRQINIKGVEYDEVFPRQEKYMKTINSIKNCRHVNTLELFAKETKFMKHCIASYADRSYNDKYIVVHISGGQDVTVGIEVCQSKGFVLNQIKSIRNSLPNKESLKIAKKVIKKLNSA